MGVVMFTKRAFKGWLIIGGGGLGVLMMVLLLQCNAGKQPINTTAPLSAVQTSSKMRSPSVKPGGKPLTALNTSQQSTKPNPSPLKKLENVPTGSDASEAVPALNKQNTINLLVDSLSDEDIKVLQGLTLLDVLSDNELEELDRKIVEYLAEAVVVVPRIMELRAMIGELDAAINHATSRDEQERAIKKLNEVFDEIESLTKRASELDAFLTDKDITSIRGDLIDTDKVERLFKDVWSGNGLPTKPPEKR